MGNGMSVGEFAVELGVTVAEIEDLLTGKEAIGREIAWSARTGHLYSI